MPSRCCCNELPPRHVTRGRRCRIMSVAGARYVTLVADAADMPPMSRQYAALEDAAGCKAPGDAMPRLPVAGHVARRHMLVTRADNYT